jgi:hypothetical protein
MQAGCDSLKLPSTIMEDFLSLRYIKDLLVSLKREVERCLVKLVVGQIPSRPGSDETKFKPDF